MAEPAAQPVSQPVILCPAFMHPWAENLTGCKVIELEDRVSTLEIILHGPKEDPSKGLIATMVRVDENSKTTTNLAKFTAALLTLLFLGLGLYLSFLEIRGKNVMLTLPHASLTESATTHNTEAKEFGTQ
jgi:hypothetical protein